VPYLEHGGARIWESLAILEYCAEIAPALWPAGPAFRAAHARAIAAGDGHAGFRGLRMAMPMNILREFPGQGRTPDALADIARIEAIWAEALAAHGGPFLFGAQPCGRMSCSPRWPGASSPGSPNCPRRAAPMSPRCARIR